MRNICAELPANSIKYFLDVDSSYQRVAMFEATRRQALLHDERRQNRGLWPRLSAEIVDYIGWHLEKLMTLDPANIALDYDTLLTSSLMDPDPKQVFDFCSADNVSVFFPTFDFEKQKRKQYDRLLHLKQIHADQYVLQNTTQIVYGYEWANKPHLDWVVVLRTSLQTYFLDDSTHNLAATYFRNAAWKRRNSHFFHSCIMAFVTGFIYETVMQTINEKYWKLAFHHMIRSYINHALPLFSIATATSMTQNKSVTHPFFEDLKTDSARIWWASVCIPYNRILKEVSRVVYMPEHGVSDFFEEEFITNNQVSFLKFAQVQTLDQLYTEYPSGDPKSILLYFDQLNLS